jgi:hypothetical protein
VYPEILSVARSDAQRPLAVVNIAQGCYRVVLAAEPASDTQQIGIRSMMPWSEWPMTQTSPTFVALVLTGQLSAR